MASEVDIGRKERDQSVSHAPDSPESPDSLRDLVQRVASSSTFEKSPKLRAFLLYVCRCALDHQPAAATEQQIGIHVFGRQPGYNSNEDNIVRSHARLLRLKLEHHFAHDGRHEPLVITIPKGQYLPAFEHRTEEPAPQRLEPDVEPRIEPHIGPRPSYWPMFFAVLAVALVSGIVWLLRPMPRGSKSPAGPASEPVRLPQPEISGPARDKAPVVAPIAGEIRIDAGKTDTPYVDVFGRHWNSDEFYQGGISQPGPQDLFPPVPDPDLFKTIREGATSALGQASEFRYDIPVPPGVYELRLYFADPIRHTPRESGQDTQNLRHFQVNVNGQPLLTSFDAIADAGAAPFDVRAFKDISPAQDGKVHLRFVSAPERPFLSALELTPGEPGRLKPIRLSAHKSDFVDTDGTRWSGDRYFIDGTTTTYPSSESGTRIPELYTVERYGNFSYAIPVPPGSYTLKLHFMESFFATAVPNMLCRGAGCRVFDVTCNGVALLTDFDVLKAAGGDHKPLIRTFHNLHPNGQGKLLISFSPKFNYAEIRAIEVIDEAR